MTHEAEELAHVPDVFLIGSYCNLNIICRCQQKYICGFIVSAETLRVTLVVSRGYVKIHGPVYI